MAQRVSIDLVDDLDGESQADETVTFSLDGKSFEVDLSSDNAARLRDSLADYISSGRLVSTAAASAQAAGRKNGKARKKAAPPAPTRSREEQQLIREWGRANGHSVADLGRISANLIRAYEDAHA